MASTVQMNDRAVREDNGNSNLAGVVLIVLGVALVVTGALMLAYLGMTVLNLCSPPTIRNW